MKCIRLGGHKLGRVIDFPTKNQKSEMHFIDSQAQATSQLLTCWISHFSALMSHARNENRLSIKSIALAIPFPLPFPYPFPIPFALWQLSNAVAGAFMTLLGFFSALCISSSVCAASVKRAWHAKIYQSVQS